MANYSILLQAELRWVNGRNSFAKGLGGARCRRVVASSSASQEIDTSMVLLGLCSGSPLAATGRFFFQRSSKPWPQRKQQDKTFSFVNLYKFVTKFDSGYLSQISSKNQVLLGGYSYRRSERRLRRPTGTRGARGTSTPPRSGSNSAPWQHLQ